METTNRLFVSFDDDYYTLPNAIKRICKTFGMDFDTIKKKNKDGVIEYKTIYQRLRRELVSMRLTERDIKKTPGGRKTQYSKAILNGVVNDKLYFWLCKKAGRIKPEEYKQLEDKRKKYRQAYSNYMAKVRQEDLTQPETDRLLDEEFRRCKLEIALEYIFEKCIKLDEQKLRYDIALTFIADESDPSPEEEDAIGRMKDYKNYYEKYFTNMSVSWK